MFNITIGCGQGGSRLAKTVAEKFKIPARYINFADVDYVGFGASNSDVLVMSGDGTGRNAELGEELALKHLAVIDKFIVDAARFSGCETVCLCVGGGGGSGTGLMIPVIKILQDNYPKVKILLMYTLPCKVEGLPAKPQALNYLNKLIGQFMRGEHQVAPLLIDNEYCTQHYVTDKKIDAWKQINNTIANTLAAFYALTCLKQIPSVDVASGRSALDLNDLRSILFYTNGFIDTRVANFDIPDCENIRKVLTGGRTFFEKFDLKTAKAYMVAIAFPKEWQGFNEIIEFENTVFETVSKMTKPSHVALSSFYSDRVKQATVYILFAGITGGPGLDKYIKNTARYVERVNDKKSIKPLSLKTIKKSKFY